MDRFLVSANKCVLARITFRVVTANGLNNIFIQVEKFTLAEIKYETWGYFVTEIIGNVTQPVSSPPQLSSIKNIIDVSQEQTNFYYIFLSDMI